MGVGTTLALPTCQCAPWLCTHLRMGSSPLSLPAPLPETPDLCPVTQLGFLRFGDCDYGARVDTGVGPRPVLCVGVCLGKLVPPPGWGASVIFLPGVGGERLRKDSGGPGSLRAQLSASLIPTWGTDRTWGSLWG